MSADEGLQIGRRKKANRLADYLRKIGVTAQQARGGNDAEWLECDRQSRGNRAITDPPSAETRALVIAELESDPKDEDVPA